MTVTHFSLMTNWHFSAPLGRVWALIERTEDWPTWWRAVKRVEAIAPGDANGLGAIRRLTWATALPYTLSFDVETVRIEPMHLIEGRAFGELDGMGRWTLSEEPHGTHVRYEWQVVITRPWMRLMAPLLRPAFEWNHHKVMAWGEQGAKQRLENGPSP